MLCAPAIAGLLVGVLPAAASGTTTSGASTASEQATDSQPLGDDVGTLETAVTLLTGDVVTVNVLPTGERTFTVDPAPRESGMPVTFTSASDGDHFYVVPSDAAGYLAAGALDLRLFDVVGLARDGYDADSGPPSVIVQYGDHTPATHIARNAADLRGSIPSITLTSIHAVALDVTRTGGAALWADVAEPVTEPQRLDNGIEKVWLDSKIHVDLDVSVPQIGAPEVWNAGYDGTGVTVAVLDTGIDLTHPDLAGKVVASENFSDDPSVVDGNGHGTHVASIATGTGAASGGQYKGVAPGASLMVGKVLTDGGTGFMSWAIAGMEWATHNGADVVNLSLSAPPTDGTDPGSEAVNTLSAETGTLFVIASGNDFSDAAVGAPGAATAALTVGAVDDNDALADFSNRGPRRGDAAIKPNITAPGVGIVAARAAGTNPGPPVGAHYTELSGTSMATPHVAGAAALLAQAHPDWDYNRLKDALASTATAGSYTPFQQGSGRVDVARAIRQEVYGPATADFGRIANPGTDLAVRTLTYHNDGDAAVTLDLSVSGRGWDGHEISAATLQLSAADVTIPAGSSATVDLVADPTQLDAGVYSGIVTGSTADGLVTVRTPWSLYEASNTYSFNTSLLDRGGKPAALGLPIWVVKVDSGFVSKDPFQSWSFFAWTDEQGNASFEVAPGVYDVYAQITTWDLTTQESTIAIASEVTVGEDTSVTLDARDAKRRNPQVGERVDQLFGEVGVIRHTPDDREFTFSALLGEPDEWQLYSTPSGQPSLGWTESYTKWIYGSELVSVTATGPGSSTLHPEYWPRMAGPELAGNRNLPVVFAGGGTDEEVALAQGKLALIRIDIPPGLACGYCHALNEIQRVSDLAVAHGVEGLLFYADMPGAKGIPVRAQPILQLGLSREEGEALRALSEQRPNTRLAIKGRRSPERVYHVRLGHDGGFPGTHDPLIAKSEFATIPARYHSDMSAQEGQFAWFAFSPNMEFSGQLTTAFWAPAAWTELVASRGPDLRWLRETWLEDTVLRTWNVLAPGERHPVESWFQSPVHYGAMDVVGSYPTTLRCTFCRQGDMFVTGQYRMDAQGEHYQYAWFDPPEVRLFQGDREIPRQGSSWRWFQLPPGDGTYRLNMVYIQPGSAPGALAPRIETDWVFNSTPPEAGQLPEAYECPFVSSSDPCAFDPLIQLRYDLGLSLNNTAPAGQSFTFDLRAAPISGALDQTPASDLRVWYSTDDGQSWTPGEVRATGEGGFDVTVEHPALSDSDGFVWLRVQAWSDEGASVEQTIERAYRLTD